MLALACLTAIPAARANQVPTTSSGASPTVTKTYPSGLTYQTTVSGGNVNFFAASANLNSTGGVTSAMLSPAIVATSNASDIDVLAVGCVNTVAVCSNRGTITITFNRAVTNPVLHISGIGGNTGGTASRYHTQMVLTGSTGVGAAPTLTRLSGTTNLQVVGGNTINSPTINGATSCTATPAAGCGSVRIVGTVTSVTFRLDLLMSGTGANPTGTASDGWTFTISADEDFGDAPGSYDTTSAASHMVGELYLGTGVSADNVNTTNGGTITPSPLASANASTDTEDNGVAFPAFYRGLAANVDVTVVGSGGRLQAWFDWGDDGSFATAGDRVATNVADGGTGDADGVVNGVIRLSVTPPVLAALTPTIARFRWSTSTTIGATGLAPNGEVEDYEIVVLTPRADLSLTKTVSTPTPIQGTAVSFTLTVTNAAGSALTTGVTVRDTLPTGFTFVSSSASLGSYNSGTGIWTVGTLAGGASATLTINGTASGAIGSTVTNIAEVNASGLPDVDSTPNNNAVGEDDYATASFSIAGNFTCPQGSTATGSGFASSGTGARLEQIFWLDWNCGGTGSFPAGSIINKTWNAGDGLIITGQVTNITASLSTYATGTFGGDALDNLYSGVNPIGLRGTTDGQDPQFRLSFSATLNGQPVTLDYAAADAESTDGANEALAATVTGGTDWSLLETSGALTTTLTGNSFTMTDVGNAGFGSAIVTTAGLTPQINATITQGGLQAMAFGVLTPFDYSDAPLTGTSYGSARHRTIRGRSLGVSFTNEQTPYDTPAADGDVDNGVTTGTLTAGATSTISVAVTGPGQFLNAWADFNDDGDFADAGEQIATNFVDGGTGDADGTANGSIQFSVTPPSGSGLISSIARFRLSSTAGTASSGTGGFGEVEDYAFTIVSGTDMSVNKTSVVWNNGVTPAYRIPGNDVSYTISVANNGTGSVTNNSVFVVDRLPATVTFFNGDANGGGAGTDPVIFTDAGSGLTFTYATDVRFATGTTVPASFAACTYTPAVGYDPAVSFICFNPKGSMNGKSGPATPGFSLTFRSLIE